jgi:hypothetical protein
MSTKSEIRVLDITYSRQEMTKVMLSSPVDGLPPAFLSGFSDHLIINLERKVHLGLQRLEGLGDELVQLDVKQVSGVNLTVAIGFSLATTGSVNTPT